MPSGCTPDNAMAKLVAGLEAMGKEVDSKFVLNELDAGGRASYTKASNKGGADSFDQIPGSERTASDNTVIKALRYTEGGIINQTKRMMMEQRNPSGIFGEEKVRPVVDFVTAHYRTHRDNLQDARRSYFQGIKRVLDKIEPTIPESHKPEWNHYRRFYEEGGELYKVNESGAVQQAINNLSSNTISNSPTVLVGNIIEGAQKMPALYPSTMMQGMAKAIKEAKGFGKIPALEDLGVYGRESAVDLGRDALAGSRGLIQFTDVPLKNWAFYAGYLKGGEAEGLRAVQRVAFVPRLGDLPAVYYTSAGRNDIRLMSYTINTMKLYAQATKDLFTGDVKNRAGGAWTLGAMVGIPLLMTGPKGAIPQPVFDFIKKVDPDLAEQIDENSNDLSSFVQVGGLSIGVPYQIASSVLKRMSGNAVKAAKAYQDGDAMGTALHTADVGLGVLSFSKSWLGDAMVQRALRLAKDAAMDDLNEDEVLQDLVPALRK